MTCAANRTLRILLCEDDDARVRYFCRNLIGTVVDRARTPAEAIRMLEKSRYDVVFLDYDYDEDHSGKSGYGTDITRHVLNNALYFDTCETLFVIHSLNKEGRAGMMDDLVEADQKFIMMRPMEWRSDEFDMQLVREWYAAAFAEEGEATEYRRPSREAIMNEFIDFMRQNP